MNKIWPQEIEEGLILTDNAMGVMTEEPSPAALEFIRLAASARLPLLEIGAAYGNATLPALQAGGTVLANDISATELQILAQSVPAENRKRLVRIPARFPQELHLGADSLSAVLSSQVLHFFDGPTVELSFQKVREWLEPGGVFLVVVMTPSLSYYRNLRAEYDLRAARGDLWPGIFDPKTVASPEWRDKLPPMVHLFEKDILRRCAEEAGFQVETLKYFCFKHFPEKHRTDGHEYLTMTARKPAAGNPT